MVGGEILRDIIKTKQNSLSESKPRSTESVTDWKLTISKKINYILEGINRIFWETKASSRLKPWIIFAQAGQLKSNEDHAIN